MAETGYKPVPHDAAFRKALLAKPSGLKPPMHYPAMNTHQITTLPALRQLDGAAR